jgi:NADH dehydrogenase
MKKVVIIGAGFAGLTAATSLQKEISIKVTLIDRSENTLFRPLLPDLISNRISAKYLLYPIVQLKDTCGFQFICDNVNSIDFDKKIVLCKEQTVDYDILVLSCGSCTPIPPTESLRKFVHRVDTIQDALIIADNVSTADFTQFVICGGGYTGIEVASQLSKLVNTHYINKKVTIIEMLDSLVNTLPRWMQKYTEKHLRNSGVDVFLNTKLKSINDRHLEMSDGRTIDNAFLIWSTGLKASPLTTAIDTPKDPFGRIIVDSNLNFREHCFAIGDSASFKQRNAVERMSVQASISQGANTAKNIIREIKGEPLEKYSPFDPGFIIPMTGNTACGEVFGYSVTGIVANSLHYLLSAYRSYGIQNRLGIISAVFKK